MRNSVSFQFQKVLEYFLDDIDIIREDVSGETKKNQCGTNGITYNKYFRGIICSLPIESGINQFSIS